ncbi:MAG TPA: carboxypeptidase-like regulatory domain-containing protein, partial [Gemmatimonadaceae bacterium]
MSRFRSLAITILSLASATLLASVTPASAQAQTGRIAGIVTDSARAALAGTQVTVVGTRFSGVTDPSGRFSISGIPAGTYEVRVQRLGQRAQVVSGVVVTAGQSTDLNVSLATVPLSLGGVVVSAS